MNKRTFTLNPVSSNPVLRYPSRKTTVAVASGLGLLLGGCQVALEENPDACTPGEAMCRDAATLVQCDRDAVHHVIDCNDFCVASRGPEWVSYGCNAADSDDPCQCEYDILDGGIGACEPGDLYCSGDQGVTYCDAVEGDVWGTPVTVTCDEYCHLTFGPDYSSLLGCDAGLPDNICQCEYDIMDGMVAECEPGDLMCLDDGQLAICSDYYSYDYIPCSDKCVADLGEGAISLSCDATDAADPCTCVIPE
ncbi:MAG: hypothetical protein CVU59_07010 [Deltaproteobacteria bacterium HGW-Deltaproteobacteria-17]|nr:MAG: hypothetical protein CVU59_07010 [Deltaproteobacteria bacterium HGW-Deltaproteobacteria-17]